MLQAWTEVCHEIFSSREMQTMWDVYAEACFSIKKKKKKVTNDINMGLPQWARVEKIIDGVETHWLSA